MLDQIQNLAQLLGAALCAMGDVICCTLLTLISGCLAALAQPVKEGGELRHVPSAEGRFTHSLVWPYHRPLIYT